MSHAVSATRGLAGREWRRWRRFGIRPVGQPAWPAAWPASRRGNDCIYVPSCTRVNRIEPTDVLYLTISLIYSDLENLPSVHPNLGWSTAMLQNRFASLISAQRHKC
ncbi:hypothetical protein PUN28_015055 [Cardiocondyla obscurior]|uniref:Uncharacterized protein n=1 Tax=Cardiocondyla obscurior TaxID=286306 RepID=A0AAW2F1X0_9HYME